MNVFVIEHQPYHDNGHILGVSASLVEAERIVLAAAKAHVNEHDGKIGDCEQWDVEEWAIDGERRRTITFLACSREYFVKYGYGSVIDTLSFHCVLTQTEYPA